MKEMINDFSLKDKVIVITGGAGILGKIFCQQLIQNGANVVAIDSQEDSLKELHSACDSDLLNTHYADIRERKQISKIRSEILNKYGRIDGLINNAATKSPNFFEEFEKFPESDWDHVMSVNLKGAFICCQEFGGIMATQNFGSIVNVLSIYGIAAPDQRIYEGSEYLGKSINTPAVYSASKAGLWGLTSYLSTYWGEKNVRVNALSPGGIQSGQNQTFVEKYSQRVPMSRMGDPEDLLGGLIYLLSDASSYVTGQNIVVDGGLTAW